MVKKPKKRMDRRRALSHILSLSKDPDFVIGAKEVLARKPFDYSAAARRPTREQRPSALFLEISADYVLGHVVC